ncbi:ribosomal protein S27AE [Silvimonas terrae]|uniref:Ribosomal protein S27AE n=1 Tax=Silvimonas terrae TaxID=300266 RepID=A0A840R9P0_9NEIS|nr:hypothetical protein [Silvimonas terrae]MBB5190089.1 ribosomal protein S27AE [Silvimonas terrae]
MSELFYLQDSRTYVGNDMLFWAVNNQGYTSDLRKAAKYTKAEAVAQHQMRPSDIPWPCTYIDARTRPAVDMQYVKRSEALAGTGIELVKEKPIPKTIERCGGCGRFMRDQDRWMGNCGNCGEDNRP